MPVNSCRPRRRALPYTRRQIISVILVVAGVGLMGYAGSQYWSMYHTQRGLQAQWEQRALRANAGSDSQIDGVQAFTDGAFARMSIPKIQLDTIVLEGVSRRQLSVAPGHITKTARPGEAGNSVITAHRDTFFRHIADLNPGDDITLWKDGQVFRYRVTAKKVVRPEDISVLAPTTDAQLTLITCYPVYYIGPAPERLVVLSKLVP